MARLTSSGESSFFSINALSECCVQVSVPLLFRLRFCLVTGNFPQNQQSTIIVLIDLRVNRLVPFGDPERFYQLIFLFFCPFFSFCFLFIFRVETASYEGDTLENFHYILPAVLNLYRHVTSDSTYQVREIRMFALFYSAIFCFIFDWASIRIYTYSVCFFVKESRNLVTDQATRVGIVSWTNDKDQEQRNIERNSFTNHPLGIHVSKW